MSNRFGRGDPAASYGMLNELDDGINSLQSRLPYAMATFYGSWTFSASNAASSTFALPADRFTVGPIVIGTAASAIRVLFRCTASSATSITVEMRTADNSTVTGTFYGYLAAFQSTPTSAVS